jgi:hypothetical protein
MQKEYEKKEGVEGVGIVWTPQEVDVCDLVAEKAKIEEDNLKALEKRDAQIAIEEENYQEAINKNASRLAEIDADLAKFSEKGVTPKQEADVVSEGEEV